MCGGFPTTLITIKVPRNRFFFFKFLLQLLFPSSFRDPAEHPVSREMIFDKCYLFTYHLNRKISLLLLLKSPLDEYPSLHGVYDAAKPRLLLCPSQHQPHLTCEGGGQPITHLWWHRVRLDIAELVLRVHQPPNRDREKERDVKAHVREN